MLALDKAIPSVYEGVDDRQQDHRYLCSLEESKIGTDHSAIGAWLLESWRIPQKITDAVGLSHSNVEGVESNLDPKVIQCMVYSGPVADCIYCDEEYKNYMEVAEMAEKQFGLDITDFLTLIGKLTEEYQEMAVLFDIDIGDHESLEANAENAKQILLKSMGVV